MVKTLGIKLTEDQTRVSEPCIVGRNTAGGGGLEELTGAQVVEQLPESTADAAGKMTAEHVQAAARSIVCEERFGKHIAGLDYWSFWEGGGGYLSRDTTDGGLDYAFDGLSGAGWDAVGTVPVSVADQLVEVDVTADADVRLKIYICRQDVSPYIGYSFRLVAGSSDVYIYKGDTPAATVTLDTPFQPGRHLLAAEKKAGKVRGYIDGVEVISITDDDYQSGNSSIFFNTTQDGAYTAKLHRYTVWRYL